MKVTQMPPVHAANLVANSGNIAYGVGVIGKYLFQIYSYYDTCDFVRPANCSETVHVYVKKNTYTRDSHKEANPTDEPWTE